MITSLLVICCICVVHGSKNTYFRRCQAGITCPSEETVFTEGNTSSLMKNLALCSELSSCRSMFFNGDLNICHGCSRDYHYHTDLPSSPGTECFWKPPKYEEPCTGDTECVAGQYQICYMNACTCKPGYPYDPTTNSCTTGCAVYGSEFQVYAHKKLDEYYVETWLYQVSPEDCKTRCISQYWCRSFEYSSMTMECIFRNGTAATKPDKFVDALFSSHFNRNCV